MLGAPMAIMLPGVLSHTLTAPVTAYGIAKNRPLPPYLLAVTLHILNNLSARASSSTPDSSHRLSISPSAHTNNTISAKVSLNNENFTI